MSNVELYTQRTRIWLPDKENIWKGAKLVKDFKEGDKQISVVFENADGEDNTDVDVVKLDKQGNLPFLRNPEILVGENDLTSLSYLHEPAVLHNLQIRFVEKNAIYTYCGIVLVAINPYFSMDIYSDDFIQLYSGRNLGEMDPHIFAIAEEAFNQMTRDEKNQSIIVTGESGAGKTVSAKFTMRYFASVGGTSKTESTVEQKVLASNPIMEAIGNAKTIRNDNSSRFGKYIELSFSKNSNIIGANMRTYLLEKSRVVSQADNERNYHIFYQLCSCADMPQFQPLRLMSADKFEYTKIGNCMTIENVDDRKNFFETVHALTLLGVSSQYQSLMFRVLSAILHMGNIGILSSQKGNDTCYIKDDDVHLLVMCELLGIESTQMLQWFCHKKITAMAEVVVTPLKLEQALQARNALAKHMYSKLFEWIVDKVNGALTTSAKVNSFIGVLDIYGFETFQVNSFEQFCINYANEKLQQQFCQHVFKLEQEEYVKEEIEWKFIDFKDNQPCIALIENKLGILDLLNDECRMPRGSNDSWAQKLYDRHLKSSEHFEKSKLSNTSFFIVHFADKVRYEIEGFVEKNRDTVNEEQLAILKASQYALVSELFIDKSGGDVTEVSVGNDRSGSRRITVTSSTTRPSSGGRRKRETKKTVASQFQESLSHLMKTLNSTTPHYVRCIKPNDYKMPFTFEPMRASQQLRACGVLETIRISAAGYPSRWSYPEFIGRYRVLMLSKEIKKKKHQDTCEVVLSRLISDHTKYQAGKSKIFFRAGQVAYLEKLRADKLRSCALMIQKNLRCWLMKKRYIRMKRAACTIQRFVRCVQARKLVQSMRRHRAALVIQTKWRSYRQVVIYKRTLASIITIQSYTRGMFGRKLHLQLLRKQKAIVIQKHVRGWIGRKYYRKQIRSIVTIQCCIRRYQAKKQFKRLKIEARSVDHFKKLNIGMENKIMELQRKLDASAGENNALAVKAAETAELKMKLRQLSKDDDVITQLRHRITELEAALKGTEQKIDVLEEEGKIKKDEREQENKDKDQKLETLAVEITVLKEQNESQIKQSKENQIALKDELEELGRGEREKLEREMQQLQKENNEQNQQLGIMEQRYENLKDELQIVRTSNQFQIQQPNFNGGDSEEADELRRRINELEEEKEDLESNIQHKLVADDVTTQLDEVTRENERLKTNMKNLRLAISEQATQSLDSDGKAFKELYSQMEAMQLELEKRRDEVIKYKSTAAEAVAIQMSEKKHKVHKTSAATMTDAELLGSRNRMEDINVEKLDKNDLKTVLAKVYDHNRILEAELEDTRKEHDTEVEELRKQNQLPNIKKSTSSTFDVVGDLDNYHQEMTRTNHENQKLISQNKTYEKIIKTLKKQVKMYSKKLNEVPVELMQGDDDTASVTSHPVLRHKDSSVTSLGMLQYKFGDEFHIVKRIVHEYQPPIEENELPGLQSFLLFKLLRFADYHNDERMIKSLLQQIISGIKTVEKKHDMDFEFMSFWLANGCRFLHNMQQYSGEEEFADECSEQQSRHCLRNFDLSEYRPVFSDISTSLYHRLLQAIERELKPMIVPAMLETDTIQGISSTSKPTAMRGRSSSRVSNNSLDSPCTVETVLKLLSKFHDVMIRHGINVSVLRQLFRQILFFITSHALNNQLMRKELCNWSKAMQIRFNVTQIEDWLRQSYGLSDEKSLRDQLEPLVHASQLLQLKKQDEKDAVEICNMCTALNHLQIVKLLQMVTPTNDYEEKVSMKFVKIVQAKLKEMRKDRPNIKLLNDASYRFVITIPFTPSPVDLSSVHLPEQLKSQLQNLVKSI